jgi:predicted metalloprotease with PDZ domain
VTTKLFVGNDEEPWGCYINFKEYWPRWKITTIKQDSQAQKLGVKVGWKLIGLNGKKITESNYKEIMSELAAGKECEINFETPVIAVHFVLFSINLFNTCS